MSLMSSVGDIKGQVASLGAQIKNLSKGLGNLQGLAGMLGQSALGRFGGLLNSGKLPAKGAVQAIGKIIAVTSTVGVIMNLYNNAMKASKAKKTAKGDDKATEQQKIDSNGNKVDEGISGQDVSNSASETALQDEDSSPVGKGEGGSVSYDSMLPGDRLKAKMNDYYQQLQNRSPEEIQFSNALAYEKQIKKYKSTLTGDEDKDWGTKAQIGVLQQMKEQSISNGNNDLSYYSRLSDPSSYGKQKYEDYAKYEMWKENG